MTPQQWCAYARLQEQLDRKRRVDSLAWGIEAGMDLLLREEGATETAIAVAIETAARRERSHAARRRVEVAPVGEMSMGISGRIEARALLAAVAAKVTGADGELLNAIASGVPYSEMASELGASVGSLRVRALRVRRHCAAQLALDLAA